MWVPLTSVCSPSSALLAPRLSFDGPDRARASQSVNFLFGQSAVVLEYLARVGADSRCGARRRGARPGEARRCLLKSLSVYVMSVRRRLGRAQDGRDAGVRGFEDRRPLVAVAFGESGREKPAQGGPVGRVVAVRQPRPVQAEPVGKRLV